MLPPEVRLELTAHLKVPVTGGVADAAVVALLPDAVRIKLAGEVEAALEVVGGDLASHSGEILQTAWGRSPGRPAADLTDEDVPGVPVWPLRAPGGAQSVPVVASLQDHVLVTHNHINIVITGFLLFRVLNLRSQIK